MGTKREFHIHVTYGSQTFICQASQNEFLRKVCEKYNLKEDEIEIFDSKNKSFIGIYDLKDLMKVEIKKKVSSALNGTRHSPGPSTSKQPDKKELVQKLLDNRVLTGLERAFLVDLLEDFNYPSLKRKSVDDLVRPEMKNRKVQVDAANLIATRVTSTQTDELINYKPSLNSTITANDIIIQSKKLAAADKIDAAIATDLMLKSFDERRNFILIKCPFAKFVKEKYPLLFSNAEVRNELDRIFYDGKCTEFIANIEKYSPHILSITRDDDPLLLTTQSKMKSFKTVAQKKYAQDVGALLMISSLVHEDRNYLKLIDNNVNPGDFPYIECDAKQNDLYFDQHIFRIYVENIMLCEASDFKEAILCLVASYFIFNIKYPDANFSTLVTFEKLFLEANDTDENEIDLALKQIIRSIQLKWQAKSNS
ncbi:uncharacterized protein LOC129963396 [Argiope bruennichi]|uniref:Uncharacterized protein n=1 Tax=Argiope bruennichi TaxID=94029 RepID=A0A8T0EXK3_ARGBR|nr:uncharacterized protein LOC129963396 [Argiope bruennichi]KAF8783096.1 hypothetical protein HNY73_013305 [Argiope bruennichi]